ncbi:MAG: type II toxin-antitoxin system RelE/ParE family toxin [Acidaminococcaceae bacterium]|nr:type II toxin-antitoxin system RelE/ParE family toxin [Acidaminococcaceae bacterium]
MYQIIFYKDIHGIEPVNEYIEWLERQNTKDARIRKTKIRTYIKALSLKGLPLTTKLCKHLDDEIWELRPNKDRVLFAGWHNGIFVLLHCFVKEGQKTPKREIEKAKKEFADFKERWNKHDND